MLILLPKRFLVSTYRLLFIPLLLLLSTFSLLKEKSCKFSGNQVLTSILASKARAPYRNTYRVEAKLGFICLQHISQLN